MLTKGERFTGRRNKKTPQSLVARSLNTSQLIFKSGKKDSSEWENLIENHMLSKAMAEG
jgi:hypothetical protein